MKKDDILYIYSDGRAAAISKKDGSIVWEVNLKKYAGMHVKAIGQITVEGDKLFIWQRWYTALPCCKGWRSYLEE